MTVQIRLAQGDTDIDIVQNIYNSKENVNYLGGFTLRHSIDLKTQTNDIIIASLDGKDVAASEIGRNGTQRTALQLVAVLDDYRRNHLASKMYWTWTLLSAAQGRLHLTDHIIENNPVMPHVLPTLGFEKVASLRSKVRRHHAMNLWCYNLVTQGLKPFESRINEIGNDVVFHENLKDTMERSKYEDVMAKNVDRLSDVQATQLYTNKDKALSYLGWKTEWPL